MDHRPAEPGEEARTGPASVAEAALDPGQSGGQGPERGEVSEPGAHWLCMRAVGGFLGSTTPRLPREQLPSEAKVPEDAACQFSSRPSSRASSRQSSHGTALCPLGSGHHEPISRWRPGGRAKVTSSSHPSELVPWTRPLLFPLTARTPEDAATHRKGPSRVALGNSVSASPP